MSGTPQPFSLLGPPKWSEMLSLHLEAGKASEPPLLTMPGQVRARCCRGKGKGRKAVTQKHYTLRSGGRSYDWQYVCAIFTEIVFCQCSAIFLFLLIIIIILLLIIIFYDQGIHLATFMLLEGFLDEHLLFEQESSVFPSLF